jgi:peptide/nickel transport system permease protein
VQGAVTLLVLSLAVFLSVHLTGDPALYLLGPEGTQQDYEQLKKNLGLDKLLPVQYALFLGNVIQGDFGTSHITGQSARKTLMERFPAYSGYSTCGRVLLHCHIAYRGHPLRLC